MNSTPPPSDEYSNQAHYAAAVSADVNRLRTSYDESNYV